MADDQSSASAHAEKSHQNHAQAAKLSYSPIQEEALTALAESYDGPMGGISERAQLAAVVARKCAKYSTHASSRFEFMDELRIAGYLLTGAMTIAVEAGRKKMAERLAEQATLCQALTYQLDNWEFTELGTFHRTFKAACKQLARRCDRISAKAA